MLIQGKKKEKECVVEDIGNKSSQQDLKRSVVHNLDLKVHRDGTELDWMVLDETWGHSGAGIRRLHWHS